MSEGVYDHLYAAREGRILWGDEPGRLVVRIKEYLAEGKVLDAGCGDGKNALFLEQQGFCVDGFDSSALAIEGLHNRFQRAGWIPRGRYKVKNIVEELVEGNYHALVSYGLFQCLPQERRVAVHRNLQNIAGVVLFSCLTDKLPMPEGHSTEGVVLANRTEIEKLFGGWKIAYSEEGTIEEDHLPIIGPHEHAAIWIVARRDGA